MQLDPDASFAHREAVRMDQCRGRARREGGELARFAVDWAFLLDPLSSIMVLVVTGIGFLIHVYSTGYMHEEDGFYRFFAYLNLFMFSMLTLILGSNYLMMFIGWEGVGLCSYLLIGYYFLKKSAGDAAKKAFVVNRVGDWGLSIGIMLIFVTFGSLEFTTVGEEVREGAMSGAVSRRRSDVYHDRSGAVYRRHRKVGADSVVCLAAGRHGRSDARQRPDPRRNDGDGRRLHGGAQQLDFPDGASGHGGGCGRWRTDGIVCGIDRAWFRTTSSGFSHIRRSASSDTCSWHSASEHSPPASSI